MKTEALCSYEELKDYLVKIDEVVLLSYIEEKDGGYVLSGDFYSSGVESQPSVIMQIASMLAVLGEFELADQVHKLEWRHLSNAYDKKANGILQRFIQAWSIA